MAYISGLGEKQLACFDMVKCSRFASLVKPEWPLLDTGKTIEPRPYAANMATATVKSPSSVAQFLFPPFSVSDCIFSFLPLLVCVTSRAM